MEDCDPPVLDTDVILAALLWNRGAAFEIPQRLRRGEWRLVLSNHLLLEYEEVLKRNAAAIALTHDEVDRYLNAICRALDCVQLPPAQLPRLPDADDEPQLRLAEASRAAHHQAQIFGISAPRRRTVSPSCLHGSFAHFVRTTMTTLHAAIPDDLHEAVLAQAEREHISVDALISRTLRAAVALPLLGFSVEERAARGNWEDFDRIMARVPDAPPVPGDER